MSLLRRGEGFTGVASSGAGASLVGSGVAAPRRGSLLAGVATMGVGAALIPIGILVLLRGEGLAAALLLGAGLAVLWGMYALPPVESVAGVLTPRRLWRRT